MAEGNGHEPVKQCPLIHADCIKEQCALWTEMMRNQGGLQQKFGLCSLNAMVMILSEMNLKTQQKIEIPNLFRGYDEY